MAPNDKESELAAKTPEDNRDATLGALEEDDEFEEFPAEDWDDLDTSLAHLTSGSGGVGTTTGSDGNTLWEDNWDDDDIEDDFSKQLREELAKLGGPTVDTAMRG